MLLETKSHELPKQLYASRRLDLNSAHVLFSASEARRGDLVHANKQTMLETIPAVGAAGWKHVQAGSQERRQSPSTSIMMTGLHCASLQHLRCR